MKDCSRPKSLPKGEVRDAVRPPAGCRFHPRCSSVLQSCGWEGQDFIDYLEERRLDPAKYDEDDRVLGNVELWWAKGLEAGRKIEEKAPSTIISYINKVLAQAQPQLGAVDSVFTHEQKVIVRFRKPALLEPKKIDERFVECLLYS